MIVSLSLLIFLIMAASPMAANLPARFVTALHSCWTATQSCLKTEKVRYWLLLNICVIELNTLILNSTLQGFERCEH